MKQKFQQRKTRRGWEVRVGWKLAFAGAVLAASMAGTSMAVAQGPSASVTDPVGQQPGSATTHEFHIPAGSLKNALDTFHDVTGLRVKVKVGADDLASFRTAGLQGTFSNAVALHQLLDKTGLSFVFEGAGAVEIAVRNAESVDVNSSIASVGLQQISQPLLDTAQTVSVVPQYVMQEQAVTGLRDGLRNVPGISLAAGEGGSQGDTLTIRGFNARNDIYLDGIRDFGSYYRDSFDYQSIDVLQGPASVEFGRGSTGGVVNQETKQPEVHEFVRGGLQLGTNAMRRVTVDVNEPIEQVKGGAAFRLNVVGEETSVSERDITNVRRFGIAPSLALGLNTKTRLFLNYLHEGESDVPDYGLPYFGAGLVAAPRTTFYGFASDNYLRTNPDVLTGKVEHDFKHLTLRNTLRWANYPRDVRITEPQINTTPTLLYANSGANAGKTTYVDATTVITAKCDPTVANTATTAACYPVGTPLSQVFVKRNQLVSNSVEDILWDQVSGSTHFNVGHIGNDAIVILEGGRERSRPTRNSYILPYVPVLNPNADDPFAPLFTYAASPTHVESQSFGIGFLDTMRLTSWLQASGGVRFDYFSTQAKNAATATPTAVTPASFGERIDKQPTYRAALVAKPATNGSVYFDYGTSFNPAAESLSLSANNAISPPEYNETFELGVKWAWMRDRLNLNSSVFRTEKLNARETDPTNSNNTINAGNQLVRGFQLGMLGHMPQGFDLILGYAYLDGRVESSIVDGSPFAAVYAAMLKAGDPRAKSPVYFLNPAGFALANVPKNSGNVWVTHRLLKGFSGGFGGSYVGARRASSTAPVALPNTTAAVDPATVPIGFKAIKGYTLLNAMLKKSISERLDLQVNVNNLTNAYFIDQPHPNHLVPGEGVNGQIGLNYKF